MAWLKWLYFYKYVDYFLLIWSLSTHYYHFFPPFFFILPYSLCSYFISIWTELGSFKPLFSWSRWSDLFTTLGLLCSAVFCWFSYGLYAAERFRAMVCLQLGHLRLILSHSEMQTVWKRCWHYKSRISSLFSKSLTHMEHCSSFFPLDLYFLVGRELISSEVIPSGGSKRPPLAKEFI